MPIPKDPKKRAYMFSDDMKFLQKAIVWHETERKFLALKRPESAFSRPECWDLPGGNVLYGQTHIDSLNEEIKEETTLEVENIKPLKVTTNYDKEKEVYFLFIGYECKAKAGEIKLSEEHVDYKWLTKEEFLQLESADFLVELVNLIN